MSDSYITIVPANVTHEQVTELSRKAFDWLAEREIISKNLSDCVLGQEKGYQPGQRYNQIIEGDDFGLLGLKTNGLEIVTRRQVFENGENGLEQIKCPKCGANNIDSEWGEIIARWFNGQNDNLKCVQCSTESSIVDYEFKPTWAFGELGLTFWNWQRLTSTFLDDLKKLWNRDLKVIYGRV
jgi:hypothetical protein